MRWPRAGAPRSWTDFDRLAVRSRDAAGNLTVDHRRSLQANLNQLAIDAVVLLGAAATVAVEPAVCARWVLPAAVPLAVDVAAAALHGAHLLLQRR